MQVPAKYITRGCFEVQVKSYGYKLQIEPGNVSCCMTNIILKLQASPHIHVGHWAMGLLLLCLCHEATRSRIQKCTIHKHTHTHTHTHAHAHTLPRTLLWSRTTIDSQRHYAIQTNANTNLPQTMTPNWWTNGHTIFNLDEIPRNVPSREPTHLKSQDHRDQSIAVGLILLKTEKSF